MDIHSRITHVVSAAVTEIIALVGQAVAANLTGITPAARRGRLPSTTKLDATAPQRKGAKRHAAELGAVQAQVAAFIATSPGLRIEQINKALGTKTKDLALPLRKLLAAKKIRVEGERRATRYFAVLGGRSAGAKTSAKAKAKATTKAKAKKPPAAEKPTPLP